MTSAIRTKTKRLVALIVSTLMCVVSLFGSIPITAQAATTRIENYWSSGGKSHKLITVNGEDAFCIDFGGTASGTFTSTTNSQNYFMRLSHADRVAIDKIISYADTRGYLNYRGDSNTRYTYYSGIQRAIWQITNPYASNNSLSTWFKNQTASVYNDIMNNYPKQISSSNIPETWDYTLRENKDNPRLNYSDYFRFKDIHNWRVSSISSGLKANISNDDILTISSPSGSFSGTKKVTLSLKSSVYNFGKYHSGILGGQYVLMTAGGNDYLPITINVTSTKETPTHKTFDPASITVTKKDKDTGEPIKDATFQVSYTDKFGQTQTSTAMTNESGIVKFTGLPVYVDEDENDNNPTTKTVFTVTEISPASDYLYVSDQKSVTDITLNENEVKEITLPGYDYWPNMKKLGDAKVIKNVEGASAYEKGKNFEFTLKAENGATYTTRTDENGEAYFCNLPVGKYTLAETPDSKYVTPKSKEFYIDWDSNTSTENRDYSNDSSQFTQVETESYGDNNDVPNYDVLIPDQNTNNSNSKEYQYDDNINCSLRVVLTNEDDEPISNANFLLMNANYVVYGTITTNEDGIAEYDNLPAGRYIIKQQTTADGYVIRTADKIVTFTADETDIDVTITNDKGKSAIGSDEEVTTGRVVTNVFNFTNIVKRGDLRINKNYEILGTNPLGPDAGRNPGQGFKFEVKSPASKNALGVDLTYQVVTGMDGTANLCNIPIGEYTVSEIEVPNMYRAPESQTVTVEWDKETKYEYSGATSFGTQDSDINADTLITADFTNMLNRYTISGHKSDENGRALAGAVFGIFSPAETEFTIENAFATSVSDENGSFAFTNVPMGDYEIAEIKAPEGYLIKADPQIVKVDGSNQNYIVEFTNTAVKGQIQIIKNGKGFISSTTDESGLVYKAIFGPMSLKGTVFSIYAKEDIYENGVLYKQAGELVETITTDKDGVAKSSLLPLGKYTVKEDSTINGYILSTETYDIELKFADDVTPVVVETLSVENKRQTISISLNKKMELDEKFGIGMNKEYENVLYGLFAKENMTAADGSVIPAGSILATATPDENGLVSFDADLPYGYTYLVAEINTDEKYVLDETTYEVPFTIEDSSVDNLNYNINEKQGVEIENKIIRGTITITKTDVATGKVIPGCKIEITDKDGNVIVQGTTNKDGKIEFTLPYGTYFYREYEAPEGYILDETPHEFTINENGQMIKAKMTNKAIIKPVAVKTGATLMGATTLGFALVALGVLIIRLRKKD